MTLAELIQLNRDSVRLPPTSGDTRTFQQFDPSAVQAQRQLRPAWQAISDPINATIGGDRAAQGRVLANVQQAVTDPMMIGNIAKVGRPAMMIDRGINHANDLSRAAGSNPTRFGADGVFRRADGSVFVDHATATGLRDIGLPVEINQKYRTDKYGRNNQANPESINGQAPYDVAPANLPSDFYRVDPATLKDAITRQTIAYGDVSNGYAHSKAPAYTDEARAQVYKLFPETVSKELEYGLPADNPNLQRGVGKSYMDALNAAGLEEGNATERIMRKLEKQSRMDKLDFLQRNGLMEFP